MQYPRRHKLFACLLALVMLFCTLPLATLAGQAPEGEPVSSLPPQPAPDSSLPPDDESLSSPSAIGPEETSETTIPDAPGSLPPDASDVFDTSVPAQPTPEDAHDEKGLEPEPEPQPESESAAAGANSEPPAATSAAPPQAEPTPQSDTAAPAPDPDEGVAYAKGQLLVAFEPGLTTPQAQDALAAIPARPMDEDCATALLEGQPVTIALEAGTTVATALEALQGRPGILSAQPNYIYRLPTAPSTPIPDAQPQAAAEAGLAAETTLNDPLASRQWHLDTIGAYDAWDLQRGSNAPAVKVAVLDTGLETGAATRHPDLAANVDMANAADLTLNAAHTPRPLQNDIYGHGTHVAGIISAVSNNGVGVSGVSYNTKIVPVKVFEADPAKPTAPPIAYTATIAAAVRYAASLSGVRVINMSLGSQRDDAVLRAAIQAAAAKGIVCVAAAGNDGVATPNYPSDYPECISVTATDSANVRASFSDYNSNKDIAAPGVGIYSTDFNPANPNDPSYSYGYDSGTSMAAPMVAAAAALLFGQSPGLSAEQVKALLFDNATDLGAHGYDPYYGHGLLNLPAALSGLAAPGGLRVALNPGRTSATLSWTPLAGGKTAVDGYQVLCSEDGARYVVLATLPGASVSSYVDSGLSNTHSYTYALRAYRQDAGGMHYGARSSIRLPVWASGVALSRGNVVLVPGSTHRLVATVQPANAANTAVSWRSSAPNVASVSSAGAVTAHGAGSAVVTATTADGGFTATCTVTVERTAIQRVAIGKVPDALVAGQQARLTASVSPAGTALTRNWSSAEPGIATVDDDGLVTGVRPGTVRITLEIGGKTDAVSIRVVGPTTGVKLAQSSIRLAAGKSASIGAAVYFSGGDSSASILRWKSSNTKVAKVSQSGKITAAKKLKKDTKVTVTATAENGKSAKIKVTVLKKGAAATPVSTVVISKAEKALDVGKTLQLKAKIAPADATGAAVSWKSSKKSVLAVDKTGRLTAKKEGTAKITLKAGGKSAKVSVKVTAPVRKISLPSKKATLKAKKSVTLVPVLTYKDAAYTGTPKLAWRSSNTKVAKVNSEGKVTAKKKGKATITVKATNGKKATMRLTVK